MFDVTISKMVTHSYKGLFALLIFTCANAAPSASGQAALVTKLEQIAKVETSDTSGTRLDIPITLDEATQAENKDAEGQRQKRFYNYYGNGFPPMSPVIYPGFPTNDPYPGAYEQDPLQHIYRRLQDIAGVVRNPNYNTPPPPPFPIFFPVLFVPQFSCHCSPSQGNKPNQNGTVDVTNRFPDMDDTNQNWGILVNETEQDDGMPEDFTRPISFVPIKPNRTMSRPPPSVEHGSSQGQEGRDPVTTTTTPPPPTPPTACDAAVLSCCHQSQVTYECFVAQGCPDVSSYGGNPCQPQVILQVVNRFSRYYGQRSG